MNIRRLVKSGNSSFTVAVPKEWIDKNKLKRGDVIYINENPDNTLTVSREQGKKREVKEIILNGGDKSAALVSREILSAYLKGINKIIVQFPKDRKDLHETMSEIRKVITWLAAMEIVEEDSRSITVKSFLDYTEVSIEELVRRIDNMARSMLLDSMESIEGEPHAEVLKERDLEVNRLVFLIFRILIACAEDTEIMRINKLSSTSIIKYWHLSFLIEEMGDIAKRAARRIEETVKANRKLDRKRMKMLYRLCIDIYCDTMKSIYVGDMNRGVELEKRIKAAQEECRKYMRAYPDAAVYNVLGRLQEMLSKIKDMTKITSFLS